VLPMGIIYNVAVPTMAIANTASIMISSKPASEDSPMTRLINARYKDTGISLFCFPRYLQTHRTGKRVYKTRIFTTICNNCRLRGREKCTHNVEMPWSNQQQSAKIEAILADQKEIYRREIMNEDGESSIVKAFDKELVDDLDATNYSLDPSQEIRHVFIGIDPAAGGNRSMFSIVSMVVVKRHTTDPNEPNHDVVVRFLFLYIYLQPLPPPPTFHWRMATRIVRHVTTSSGCGSKHRKFVALCVPEGCRGTPRVCPTEHSIRKALRNSSALYAPMR